MIQGSESIQASSNTDRSKIVQGAASLRIECSGYGILASNAFSTRLLNSKEQITLLLRMPETLENPWWAGAVDLFVSSPSANQFRQPLGHIDLQGKSLGKWSALSFSIPTYLKPLFSEVHDDVYFEIALNSGAGAGPFYLDGLGGLDSRYTVRIEEGNDASITVLFWDHSTTQAQLQYTINNGEPQSATMTGLEGFDRFDATIHGLVPGDQITWQVRFQNDGEWMETGWSTYTTLGEHKYVSVGDEVRQVGLYNTSNPIVIKPEWSTRYAVLVTRRALTNAEQATVESMGVNILGISHSAHHGYYTVSYTGNINTLAQSLQTGLPAFFNIAPMTKAKPVQRASRPYTAPEEPILVIAACYADVSLQTCKNILMPYAENGHIFGNDVTQGLHLRIQEFSLDLLRQLDQVKVVEEPSEPQPSDLTPPPKVVRSRAAAGIDALQSRLGNQAFSKATPINTDWLKGMSYTGEDIEVNISDMGINPNVPDFQEDGISRAFNPGETWEQNLSDANLIWPALSLSTTWNFPAIRLKNGNYPDAAGHGIYVASIVLGNGVRTPAEFPDYYYRGVAPKAKLWSSKSESNTMQSIPGYVSNHSYGGGAPYSPVYRYYSGYNTDQIIHDQSFLDGKHKVIIHAAMNEGNQEINWVHSDPNDTNSPKIPEKKANSTTKEPMGQYSTFIGWYSVLWNTKNLICVGATDSRDNRAYYSSMGPSMDGRIKPDIMAVSSMERPPEQTLYTPEYPYDPIQFPPDTLVAAQGLDGIPEEYVGLTYGGTSSAAPQVTGIVALMQQKLRNEIVGCTPSVPCPEFDTKAMRNSTAKAILIQTAKDLIEPKDRVSSRPYTNPDQEATEKKPSFTFFGKGPDFATGWGLVNAEKAVDHVDPSLFAEVAIQEGQQKEFYFDLPANPTEDLNLTIAWDDLGSDCAITPGLDPMSNADVTAYFNPPLYLEQTCQHDPQLVNDIDLYLEAPNGQKFYPWKLKPFLGPQSWDKMPYNPNVGIDPIFEERVEKHIAYRGCQKSEDPSNTEVSVENCFDHLNNVEKVTVYNTELFDLDNLGYNRMSGRWKAVIKGNTIQGEQIVSVSSDYPISQTAPNFVRMLWIDYQYSQGSNCLTHFDPISGDLYSGLPEPKSSYVYLCATKYNGSIPIYAPEGSPPLTSILVGGQNSAPASYSHVPNITTPGTIAGVNLNPNVDPPIYIYTSTEPLLGAPIHDIKTVQASPNRIEADTGWIRIPKEIHQSANGQNIYLSYRNADTRPITDLYIITDNTTARCPTGYENLSGDLNRVGVGFFCYLCGSRDPAKGAPIVELTTGSNYITPPDGFENIKNPWSLSTDPARFPINLKHGSPYGGDAMYLYQRRSTSEPPIQDISYISWDNDNVPVPSNWSILDQNLNEGTGENYVYLVFKR